MAHDRALAAYLHSCECGTISGAGMHQRCSYIHVNEAEDVGGMHAQREKHASFKRSQILMTLSPDLRLRE